MSKARVAVVIVAVCVLVSDCTPAPKPGPEEIAPGVVYELFDAGVSGGRAHVHLLTADITHPDVRVEALSAGSVAAADEPSAMAREAGAVGVINGDYLNQLGENKTNAPVGPMIIDGAATQWRRTGAAALRARATGRLRHQPGCLRHRRRPPRDLPAERQRHRDHSWRPGHSRSGQPVRDPGRRCRAVHAGMGKLVLASRGVRQREQAAGRNRLQRYARARRTARRPRRARHHLTSRPTTT
jgi:hypothetical protein